MNTNNSEVNKTVLEYIWLGGRGEIRSKIKVINKFIERFVGLIPEWNYDGSSTFQADSEGDTEVILKPCAVYNDPTRNIPNCVHYLVLCDTYKSTGEPLLTNTRHNAEKFFDDNSEFEPWFGLEQEYFIRFYKQEMYKNSGAHIPDGFNYCCYTENNIERAIVEQHLQLCLETGLHISGINAEVTKGQWEFQVGPCEGISAADELIVARHLLNSVAEKFGAYIIYHPKPVDNKNGSGCHINFSNSYMRYECGNGKHGIDEVYNCINRLEKKHSETIKSYGENNHLRLTGYNETSDYDKFSWGVGTRNTSIRIPNCAKNEKTGIAVYFEDRRPAANIDPYKAIYALFKDSCFDD